VPTSDRDRFERLYRAHYPAVLRYARRRVAAETAEMVVAEVFTTAWQKLERVPNHALPWLLVCARHVIANERRREQRAQHKSRRARSSFVPAAADHADGIVERDALVRAIAKLSARDREVLALVAWDGLSISDAARVAGTTRASLAMRLSRARRRLGAALDAPDATPDLTRPKEHPS